MKKRQHNTREQHDLEYLSELAFSEIKVNEQEIRTLRYRFRRRIQHLSILSVIVTLIIAFLAVVFLSLQQSHNRTTPPNSESTSSRHNKTVVFAGDSVQDPAD